MIDKVAPRTHFDLFYSLTRTANICLAEIFIPANNLLLLFSCTSD